MIQHTKETDERREAGPLECWCLHGAVGMAADWRGFAKNIAARGIGTRAVDLWRFLQCDSLPLTEFGKTLNADAAGQIFRGSGRALLGYSMGGRLALHALLEKDHPWQAAVIVSTDPGIEDDAARTARRTADTVWATQSLAGGWAEFLAAWDAQPVLAGAPVREAQASAGLVMRRREIARSFVDWSLGAQEPLWNRLSEIQVPVLWIAGESDTKFRELGERAVSVIPRGTLLVAPAAGHRVPWDAPEWFVERVAAFLSTAR